MKKINLKVCHKVDLSPVYASDRPDKGKFLLGVILCSKD